jgi:hypothetical protein
VDLAAKRLGCGGARALGRRREDASASARTRSAGAPARRWEAGRKSSARPAAQGRRGRWREFKGGDRQELEREAGRRSIKRLARVRELEGRRSSGNRGGRPGLRCEGRPPVAQEGGLR